MITASEHDQGRARCSASEIAQAAIDQTDVAERLWEVSKQLTRIRIDLLCQQTKIIGKSGGALETARARST